MSALSTRTKLVGAVIGAFICGLVFASGLDLTRFGYAQSRSVATQQVANSSSTAAPPASVAALNASFVDLAERLTPAVVSIEAARNTQPARQQAPRAPRGFEEFFDQFDPRQRQPSQASGSGFIVSRDGYILTNNHVVADFDQVRVTLTDRRSFDAKVVGRDATTDVAVLKINGSNLPVAALGDDANVRIGEWVLAIGNPLGLDFTVTAGIVSAKGRGGRDLPGLGGENGYGITDMIQTDAAINPGNSGGPLVNINGQVIGINAAIASNTGLYSGYGFAIPITLAKTVMDDIIAHGRVRRAVLGVSIDEVSEATAKRAKLDEIAGVLVTGYPEGVDSPARRAGIELGDVIVKADGKRADHVGTLQRIIRNFEPGQNVTLEVVRGGEHKNITVKLAEAPQPNAQVARDSDARNTREGVIYDRLGIEVQPVSDAVAREYEIPAEHRGVRVTDVSPTSSARASLSQYDVIEAILYPTPRKTVRTVEDVSSVLQRLRPGDVVSLLVYNVRVRSTRVVDIELGGK